MITYRATLDVPAHTAAVVTRWIAAHRRAHDIRPWQRAATARTQALLVLRWFKDATRVHLLARDAGVSTATAYRYLHEAIDMIAARAPDLGEVLATAHQEDWPFVCLDGTLIPTMQLHGPRNPSGAESWYSGKYHRHGGNIQVLCDPHRLPRVGLSGLARFDTRHHRGQSVRAAGALSRRGRRPAHADRLRLPGLRHRDLAPQATTPGAPTPMM